MKMRQRMQRMEMPVQNKKMMRLRMQGFFSGLLVGGLVGAGTMLLMAPKSGKRMRSQLQHQVDDLREQMAENLEDAEETMFVKARHAAHDVRERVEEMQHQGQAVLNSKR